MYSSSSSRVRAVSKAQSVRSIAESQIGLAHSNSFRMDSLDGRSEKGLKFAESKGNAFITQEPVKEYHGPTRLANSKNGDIAFFDALVAVLALYFAAFGFMALHQNGTLANLSFNQVIFKLAAYNPTLFPILFTLIVARFIKAFANFKLERGATVGTIQHLLGSRTLVSSILTPIKLGTMSLTVLGVFLFWCLSPLGGQMSLRTVSQESNYTTVARNFHYLDFNQSPFKLVDAPNRLAPINSAYITALFSPISSKNGTQDMFGNIQIPMIEVLKSTQIPDSDGWYRTAELAQSNVTTDALTELESFLGVPNDALHEASVAPPIYASLIGIPFLRGGPVVVPGYGVEADQTDMVEATLDAIEASLFGSQTDRVINTESQFNIETSYFSLNCSANSGGNTEDYRDFPTGINTNTGIVSNNYELVISYDFNHTMNSTKPRQINLTSWSDHSGGSGDITRGLCNLTTTYIEANVYCANGNNCSIQAVRPSTLDHPAPVLSQLDGIAPPFNTSKLADRRAIPELFFSAFINATGNLTQNTFGLSPTECYFVHPENPYQCSIDNTDYTLYEIGDTLFSQRFTQLLNTYWMDNVAQYSVTGNFTLDNIYEQSVSATTPGQLRIETTVLRCHIGFMVVLVAISFALFLLGMITAYLDLNRRGPDVFDDFVNSLRHSPYVHVEQGLSMEDGHEKVKRLRNTIIQLGDVRPEDPVGYVAIGTPTENQPVRMFQHDRRYR